MARALVEVLSMDHWTDNAELPAIVMKPRQVLEVGRVKMLLKLLNMGQNRLSIEVAVVTTH
jgi:hypothetical protein